jgi:hypothetical protein
MNDYTKGLIKDGVTTLLKRFMAKEIDENELVMELNTLNFLYKKGDKGIWFKWHEGHPLAITIGDIKAGLNGNPHNRGYMYECIEATVNDNSLVVNFS